MGSIISTNCVSSSYGILYNTLGSNYLMGSSISTKF